IMKSLIPWWEYNFIMCQRIGLPPISTMGFGLTCVSSLKREPKPPARITAFIESLSSLGNATWGIGLLTPRAAGVREAVPEGEKQIGSQGKRLGGETLDVSRDET